MTYAQLAQKIGEGFQSPQLLGARRMQVLAEVHPDDLATVLASMPGQAKWRWWRRQTIADVVTNANEAIERGTVRLSWKP